MNRQYSIEDALLLLDTVSCEGHESDELAVEPVISMPMSIQETLGDLGAKSEANERLCVLFKDLEEQTEVCTADESVNADTLVDIIEETSFNRNGDEHVDEIRDISTTNGINSINNGDISTTNKVNSAQDEEIRDDNTQRRGRKRKKNKENWKQSIRKRKCQAGKEYVDAKGRRKEQRNIKTRKDCDTKCKFLCSRKLSEQERAEYFETFWRLNDSEKNNFYINTTQKTEKQRKRTNENLSRRKYSYKYFFNKNSEKIRVCKQYYLTTLDISQRRIQWFYAKKATNSFTDKRGTNTKKRHSNEAEDYIKQHIRSFPRMPSHYCRQSTQKEYMEADMSLAKMYSLYAEKCTKENVKPEKIHLYRHIFNHDFNIGFYIPKKDRCDLCEQYKSQEECNQVDESLKLKYQKHLQDKTDTKTRRDAHRATPEKIVVCFDLQNVITCPRANVSNFFYKRKLNVYNMTAHCSLNKHVYNAVWSEGLAGRGANEIASALVKILEAIFNKNPNIESLVLWSDSCVPQNRNSIMCFALKKFLIDHPSVREIEQNFCTPGHSSIQEVDNAHSHIEKALKISEIYSPVSLMRVLQKVRPKNSTVIQLRANDFYHYQNASKYLRLVDIPFTKVKLLRLVGANPFHAQYKTAFGAPFQSVNIRGQNTRNKKDELQQLPKVNLIGRRPSLSSQKKADFRSMLKFMPHQDRVYFETICRI